MPPLVLWYYTPLPNLLKVHHVAFIQKFNFWQKSNFSSTLYGYDKDEQ